MLKTGKKRILSIISILSVGMALLTSGCGANEKHEIVVEEEKPKPQYSMAEAEVGDVIRARKVTLRYSQKDSEELKFKVDGYQIKGVYVQKGDKVKKGDLLAELNMENAGEEYENCVELIEEYMDSENILTEQMALALDQTQRMLKSGETDEKGAELRDLKIHEEYDPQIKEVRDLITYETMRKDYYGAQVEEGRIYAGMDGTVASVRSFSNTARSSKIQNVITLFDSEKCSFTCDAEGLEEYLTDGGTYVIELLKGEKYETVFRYSEEYDELVFELKEPDYSLSIGTKAYFSVVLEKKENVIRVPVRAVHNAGDKYFVYFSDENNIRTVQYVEAGLKGNDYYEIVSGINEGDLVVVK